MPSATTTEDLRRKFIVVQQQRSAPPNLALATNQHLLVPNYNPLQTTAANASSMMTTSTTLSTAATANVGSNTTAGNMLHEPERTYVFPGPAQPLGVGGSTNGPGIPGVAIISTPAPHTLGVGGRGHARSISHGGGGAIVSAGGRPIKSAMKGHQRAFSQGQITDSPPGSAPTSAATQARGHSRVGSKTDFILPPGHKDTPEQRDFGPSAPTSAAGRGHSRQASRSESIYTLRRTETPPWWKRVGFCQNSEKFEERTYRVVVPNHTVPPKTPKREHPNGQFVGNKIHTTKYTLLSFIPKNLFEQFHRVANLYFIFIVLLNWVPEVNAFAKEVAMIPVLFVLGVTAVKDLFEDRRRRASDKRINNTQCRVYDVETERYKKIKWQDLRVGDIVHLSNNEAVPADILFLRSSDPHGVCYIDTCDLDGETNLKRREVVRGYADKHSIFLPSKFVSRVEAEAPTTKLYRFHGALIHPTGERVPISTECLLLRESRLKNTDYIEGIVVYAGHETKSMLNNSGPRYKRSQVEQQMNIDVIWCMIILLILCVVGAVGYYMWLSSFTQFPVPYLPYKGDIKPGYEGYLTFWTYIIILQVMIPLSLYVTIELCKILQVYHIHNNIDLFDQDTNKKTECRAMNITEELGQIQHIFSDKTGTLTENKMIFRRCVINGIDYNHPPSELEKMCTKPGAPAPPLIANETLIDDMTQYLNAGQYLTSNAQRIQEFLVVLAICNTVIVSAAPHRDLMNASGIIEVQQHGSHSSPEKLSHKKQTKTELDTSTTNNTTTVATGAVATPTSSIPADRYTRLAESRSVTPSPPPNLIFAMPTQNHQPTLSPISSSAESTPTSESPPMKAKALANSISPTGRAKAVFNSKITSIATFLNVRAQAKRLKMNQAKQQPLYRTPDGRPLYEAESPDELALVNAAYTYDCCLFNRSPNHILVSLPNGGTTIEYEILKVLPFDSSRKCMSIVVRRTGTQEILLYTKGADSSIMPVLAPCLPNSPEGILREKTQQQLDRYAREGLRILVMAKRVLNAADYTDWWARHQEIEMSLENRERRLRESFAKLESNLTLLGATGIEDRLQDNVPETIASLLAAGISVWVLTGDKPETAINIAYSAKLFTQQMELIRLTARSRDAAESGINCYLSDLEATKSAFNLAPRSKPRALVVDGKTLTFILDPKSKLIRPFLRLAKACASVLCCRSTPLQKAYLVKVVKEELNLRTLAIGDGANDVSMIQMADVGVGITGQEGMQAVMASDFTLSRFRYLEPLLLTHGYWCYDRLARMILYFFYKNAAFVFLIFWYQLYNGFSGQVMIDQMYLMLYNLIFTSLPPLAIGVYDKRVPEELLQKHPYLYKNGRMGLVYRPHDFWIVLLDALYQSLVIFFVALGAYAESDVGIWEFGATITASCLFTNLVHGAIEIRSWTILHVLSIVISLASFYLFSIIYHGLSWFGWTSTYFVIFRCFISAVHWLVIALSTVVAVLPRLLFTTLQTSLYPDESSKVLLHNKRERSRESPIMGLRIRL